MIYVEPVLVAIALGMLGLFVFRVVYHTHAAIKYPPIYRKIVKHTYGSDGEVEVLECGHAYRVVRYEPDSVRCESCEKERDKQKL
jgi:hypothetical protein